MRSYANLSGSSGVLGYEIGADWIQVWFTRKSQPYTYTGALNGMDAIQRMHRLAESGRGLATYISQTKPQFVR